MRFTTSFKCTSRHGLPRDIRYREHIGRTTLNSKSRASRHCAHGPGRIYVSHRSKQQRGEGAPARGKLRIAGTRRIEVEELSGVRDLRR